MTIPTKQSALCLGLLLAFAVQGASEHTWIDIGTILAEPLPEQRVRIAATLVHDLGDNEFLVEDASGRIVVEAGPAWYHRVTLPADEPLIIDGEVEREDDRDPPVVDVYSVTRSDGAVLRIRSDRGPSPWSGGAAAAGSTAVSPARWE